MCRPRSPGRSTRGRCDRLLITGEAGVGKSRLVEDVCEAAAAHALVIRGRCLSYGEGITFWPLVEALRQAAGIEEDDDLAEARAKLAAFVGEGQDDIFERLASAVGLSDQQYALQEVFWSARKLVETLSRRRPLVLVLEDLHWAEPALLDLVDHVATTAEDAPALLLCIARPEILEKRPPWRSSTTWRWNRSRRPRARRSSTTCSARRASQRMHAPGSSRRPRETRSSSSSCFR